MAETGGKTATALKEAIDLARHAGLEDIAARLERIATLLGSPSGKGAPGPPMGQVDQ